MTEKKRNSFNHRAFVSVLVCFSFILMAITGFVMFFAPSRRIARETSWSVLGFDKDQWVAIHVWFSIAFVVASIFHLYFNWRVLINYFKSKIRKGFAFRVEWIAALVLCILVSAVTLFEVPPFSSLMTWEETFKREGGGGYGRGRQATIHEKEQAQSRQRDPVRSGMEQKTLKEFCEEEGIELSWALSRLKEEGYTARETMTMREIADSKGIHPRELRDILRKGH